MGETEIRTADASGQVQAASPQSKPKAKGARRNAPAKAAAASVAQGRPVTVWDKTAVPPTERAHVGEDPDGKKNVKR